LIFLIQKYNLNLSFFLEQQDFAEADMIQNTLEQKGLWNLSTIPNVFVDPKFLKTETLIHKILEKAHHARFILSLPSLLLLNYQELNLLELSRNCEQDGILGRLTWILETTVRCAQELLKTNHVYHLSKIKKSDLENAHAFHCLFLQNTIRNKTQTFSEDYYSDLSFSLQHFENFLGQRDALAKQYKIVTNLKTKDFLEFTIEVLCE